MVEARTQAKSMLRRLNKDRYQTLESIENSIAFEQKTKTFLAVDDNRCN